MRGLALLVMLVGCDSIWDLEQIEPVDASGLPADLAAWFPMEEVAGGTITDVAGPHDGLRRRAAGASDALPSVGCVVWR